MAVYNLARLRYNSSFYRQAPVYVTTGGGGGGGGGGGTGSCCATYSLPFTNGDLSTGILTATHNMGSQYVDVAIYDDNGEYVVPDGIIATSTNVTTIDLTSYGAIPNTWNLVIFAPSSGCGGGGSPSCDCTNYWYSTTAGSIFTSGSAAFVGSGDEWTTGANPIDSPLDKGADVFFYVSGSMGCKGTATPGLALFGGDVAISGTLYGGSPLKVSGSMVITGSLTQGFNSVSGQDTHAEGYQTLAGARFFEVEEIVSDVIKISNRYNNVTTSFFGSTLWIKSVGIFYGASLSAVSFDGTNTYVTSSTVTPVTITSPSDPLYVVAVDNINDPAADAVVIGSHAEGYGTKALGSFSHAEGFITIASGDESHSEGYATKATGLYSHAEGGSSGFFDGPIASGNFSHAEGSGKVIASGIGSHAEGVDTHAADVASHSEGNATVAGAINSHAEGEYTVAGARFFSSNTGMANGVVTLDMSYGDVTSSFVLSPGLLIRATNYFNSNSSFLGTNFDGSNTHVTSSLGDSLPGTVYLLSLDNVVNQLADNVFGNSSHTEGVSSISIGEYSHAEGNQTAAVGDYSHAEGSATIAIGDYSHAEGWENTVGKSDAAHAEGYLNFIGESAHYSHAEGWGNKIVDYALAAHVEGAQTTGSAPLAHAEGLYTIAGGISSHAEGLFTTGSADFSHAEGHGTYVESASDGGHAEGYYTRVIEISPYSHAEGWQAVVQGGAAAHAEGYKTKALKNYSHAEGSGSIANAVAAHAGGINTEAVGVGQTVFGKYNESGNTTSLFVVGDGSNEANRHDVFRINDSEVQITGSLRVMTGSYLYGIKEIASVEDIFPGDHFVYFTATNATASIDTGNFPIGSQIIFKDDGSGGGQKITYKSYIPPFVTRNIEIDGDTTPNMPVGAYSYLTILKVGGQLIVGGTDYWRIISSS